MSKTLNKLKTRKFFKQVFLIYIQTGKYNVHAYKHGVNDTFDNVRNSKFNFFLKIKFFNYTEINIKRDFICLRFTLWNPIVVFHCLITSSIIV